MLFDTRYFWAVFTSKDSRTVEKLRAIYDRSQSPSVSSVTIYEVYKLTLASEGRAVATLRSDTIENEFRVVDLNAGIARDAAELSSRLRVPMADSLIMATSRRLKLPCVTDDPHFAEVKRVWV